MSGPWRVSPDPVYDYHDEKPVFPGVGLDYLGADGPHFQKIVVFSSTSGEPGNAPELAEKIVAFLNGEDPS